MKLLEQLQLRATKFFLNDYNSEHRDRLVKLNLLPVNYWHENKDLVYLHKYLNEPSTTDAFRYVSTKVVSAMILSKNNLLLQSGFAHTQRFKSSYFNRTVDLWNSLPGRIPSINSFNSFKVSLHKHLLECFTLRFKVNDIYTWRTMCTKCHEKSNLALNSACHCCFEFSFMQ